MFDKNSRNSNYIASKREQRLKIRRQFAIQIILVNVSLKRAIIDTNIGVLSVFDGSMNNLTEHESLRTLRKLLAYQAYVKH